MLPDMESSSVTLTSASPLIYQLEDLKHPLKVMTPEFLVSGPVSPSPPPLQSQSSPSKPLPSPFERQPSDPLFDLMSGRHRQQRASIVSMTSNTSFASVSPDNSNNNNRVTCTNTLVLLIQEFEGKVAALTPDLYDPKSFDKLKHRLSFAQDFAPKLDFGNIECNGIRMLLRHAESYLSVAITKNRESDVRAFMHVIRMMLVWCNLLSKFISLSGNEEEMITTAGNGNTDENRNDIGRRFYQEIFLSFSSEGMATILGPDYHIVTSPGLVLPYAMIERAIIFCLARKASDILKTFSLSRKTVASALSTLAPQAGIREIASVVRKMNSWPVKLTYATTRAVTAIDRPVSVKKVKVMVPSVYRIGIEGREVFIRKSGKQQENGVKFYLLSSKMKTSSSTPGTAGGVRDLRKKVLVYVHGGAFLGPRASSLNNFYLKDFADRLPGLTILSMDHDPAPESPFPIALQQVLDTYLWLTSGSPEVQERLGFLPQEVVLMGDSSGGNISAAVLVSLNEIRVLDPGFKPFMPRSLVLCFPKTSLQFDLFPSLCLSVFDPILSLHLMLGACIAYVPILKKRTEKEAGNGLSDGHQGNRRTEWTVVEDKMSIPMDFLMRDEYDIIKSPLLSPVRYEGMSQLSEVQLHVMAVANDPLLDESIEMARRWKGRTKMHVVDGVTHGAFLFNYFAKVGSKCVPIATDMITAAFLD